MDRFDDEAAEVMRKIRNLSRATTQTHDEIIAEWARKLVEDRDRRIDVLEEAIHRHMANHPGSKDEILRAALSQKGEGEAR